MHLKLLRSTSADTSTEGKIYDDGAFECYSLEDTDRFLEDEGTIKINRQSAIPRGKYSLIISFSNRFQKDLIEVLNVSRFTGIRIHSGNSSEDTEGCIIVGSTNKLDDDNWIGGSRIALKKLQRKVKEALDNGDEVTLEIV